ncbi:hypothetical protein HK100_006955 [Physocladia obscura]|uniref:Uncharacterized protein n=1 Tax=Physocladia obscura TaxID=109957 RepID=A0AAD5T5L1_9FUNG|nr:hypothetical protein HK100_006955 [Physocladia obscura]
MRKERHNLKLALAHKARFVQLAISCGSDTETTEELAAEEATGTDNSASNINSNNNNNSINMNRSNAAAAAFDNILAQLLDRFDYAPTLQRTAAMHEAEACAPMRGHSAKWTVWVSASLKERFHSAKAAICPPNATHGLFTEILLLLAEQPQPLEISVEYTTVTTAAQQHRRSFRMPNIFGRSSGSSQQQPQHSTQQLLQQHIPLSFSVDSSPNSIQRNIEASMKSLSSLSSRSIKSFTRSSKSQLHSSKDVLSPSIPPYQSDAEISQSWHAATPSNEWTLSATDYIQAQNLEHSWNTAQQSSIDSEELPKYSSLMIDDDDDESLGIADSSRRISCRSLDGSHDSNNAGILNKMDENDDDNVYENTYELEEHRAKMLPDIIPDQTAPPPFPALLIDSEKDQAPDYTLKDATSFPYESDIEYADKKDQLNNDLFNSSIFNGQNQIPYNCFYQMALPPTPLLHQGQNQLFNTAAPAYSAQILPPVYGTFGNTSQLLPNDYKQKTQSDEASSEIMAEMKLWQEYLLSWYHENGFLFNLDEQADIAASGYASGTSENPEFNHAILLEVQQQHMKYLESCCFDGYGNESGSSFVGESGWLLNRQLRVHQQHLFLVHQRSQKNFQLQSNQQSLLLPNNHLLQEQFSTILNTYATLPTVSTNDSIAAITVEGTTAKESEPLPPYIGIMPPSQPVLVSYSSPLTDLEFKFSNFDSQLADFHISPIAKTSQSATMQQNESLTVPQIPPTTALFDDTFDLQYEMYFNQMPDSPTFSIPVMLMDDEQHGLFLASNGRSRSRETFLNYSELLDPFGLDEMEME